MASIALLLQLAAPKVDWKAFMEWAATQNLPVLSAIFLLATFLIKYNHDINVRASDLLLKLEEAFGKFGSNLRFLEYMDGGYAPVRDIFPKCVKNPDLLSNDEKETLEDIDTCIRFLFLCTLHAGERISPATQRFWWRRWSPLRHRSLVPQAYYYYLNRLNTDERSELRDYVRVYFPALKQWLDRNAKALATYDPKPSSDVHNGRVMHLRAQGSQT